MSPRLFVEEFVRGLPPGKALDLACGSGRNALWLAERGWTVTAVDRAPSADLNHIREVDVVTADLETHNYTIAENSWDLVVMSYYLQVDLFPAILRGLKPGGLGIIIVHMFEPGHESSRFSLHPGELRSHFDQQEILAYREGKPVDGGRAVAQIAFRRQVLR